MTRTSAVSEERAGDPAAAHEAALRLLERTRRTRLDLKRRLERKGYRPDVVAGVLDRLAAVALVDDAEYARAYLAERWGRRAAGWRRLALELRGKGVGSDDVAAARAAFERDGGTVDETAAAARVVAQAERRYAALDARVRRQRLHALLLRRGFDADTIERVLTGPQARP